MTTVNHTQTDATIQPDDSISQVGEVQGGVLRQLPPLLRYQNQVQNAKFGRQGSVGSQQSMAKSVEMSGAGATVRGGGGSGNANSGNANSGNANGNTINTESAKSKSDSNDKDNHNVEKQDTQNSAENDNMIPDTSTSIVKRQNTELSYSDFLKEQYGGRPYPIIEEEIEIEEEIPAEEAEFEVEIGIGQLQEIAVSTENSTENPTENPTPKVKPKTVRRKKLVKRRRQTTEHDENNQTILRMMLWIQSWKVFDKDSSLNFMLWIQSWKVFDKDSRLNFKYY
jgi:hypothetical protein